MVSRIGRFISFTSDDLELVYLDVYSIVYIEHNLDDIIISTHHAYWTLKYTNDMFESLIEAICYDE